MIASSMSGAMMSSSDDDDGLKMADFCEAVPGKQTDELPPMTLKLKR